MTEAHHGEDRVEVEQQPPTASTSERLGSAAVHSEPVIIVDDTLRRAIEQHRSGQSVPRPDRSRSENFELPDET